MKYRIMAVDDNPTILKLLSLILEDKYELKLCQSGEEALDMFNQFKPHILLMDIMMPGMKGYEVAKKIRGNLEWAHTKILFISAKTSLEDRLQGYQAGADDYLIKPFEEEELLAKLRVFIKLINEEESQQKTREILKESEEKYRSLVQNSPDIIINIDREGNIRFLNAQLNGKSIESIIGTTIYDQIPEEYHAAVAEKIDRVFTTGLIDMFEFHLAWPKEQVTWFSTRIAPIRKNGMVEAATLITRDVTEQKRATDELTTYRNHLEKLVSERTNDLSRTNEQLKNQIFQRKRTEDLLHKNEENYRSILENIEEGYFEVDLDGKVTSFNESMARILSCKPEELVDLDFRTLSDDQNMASLKNTFNHVFQTGNSMRSFSWEMKRPNSRELIYLEASISLIREQEKKIGFRGLVRDVTERFQHEKTLEGLFNHAVGTLARAAEVYDSDTGDHTMRIGDYSALMARMMDMNEHYQKGIQICGQLHDVGKIHITPALLNKNGRLTSDEFEKIKNHTLYGAIIIGRNPDFKMAHEISMFHHEQYNGGGYPDGLRGRAIPLAARITSIVDVFDALISQRSYKKAFNYTEAREIMKSGDDRLDPNDSFDPILHQIFLDNYEKFVAIHEKSLSQESKMLAQRFNVFLMEDDLSLQRAIKTDLEEVLPFVDVFVFSSIRLLNDFLNSSVTMEPQLCFIDVRLPDGSGHDAAALLRAKYPEAHLICITETADIDVQKVNLYGHRVFRKQSKYQNDFILKLIKTTEIIREFNFCANKYLK